MRTIPIGLFVPLALVFALGACQRADEGRRIDEGAPASQARTAPVDTPASADPHAGHAHPPAEPVDADQLPLKETGMNSLEELERAQKATENAEARECFTRGFRLTFTSDTAQRNYAAARDLFRQATNLDPGYAEAYRGLAYTELNLGFNRMAALENYKKAIALKPDYGEAHYALAFLYAVDDRERGAVHFEKAMKLGVPDERGLHDQYYPQVKIDTH